MKIRVFPSSTARLSARRSDRGVALVMTLAIIVLISIMVVGMATSIRVERGAAGSHLTKTRAEFLAQQGIEEVIANLAHYTGRKDINWITQPGKIFHSKPGQDRPVLSESVSLYSHQDTDPADPADQVDLNSRQLLKDEYLIINDDPQSGVAPSMPVDWIYVDVNEADGSTSTSSAPGNSTIGRYAYWTDDESSKINYNTAYGRTVGSANEDGAENSLANVDLTAIPDLTGPMVDDLEAAREVQPFNSPRDARRVSQPVADALDQSRFDVTHYNHDPETTFFNEPRIALTTLEDYAPKDASGNTKKNSAGEKCFLDITKKGPGEGPAARAALGGTPSTVTLPGLQQLLKSLRNDYLREENWPILPSEATVKSLEDKYYPSDKYPNENARKLRLYQLALNVIEYVRAKEAPAGTIIEPIRIYFPGGNENSMVFGIPSDANMPYSFLGITRTPYITELGVGTSGGSKVVRIELHLPANYGIDAINLKTLWVWLNVGNPQDQLATTYECSDPDYILRKGAYVTLTKTLPFSAGSAAYIRVAISLAYLAQRLDVVPLVGGLNVPVESGNINDENFKSLQVDDPRVNKVQADWRHQANTWGAPNQIAGPANVDPPQDTTAGGAISKASLFMPPGNGLVTSVGELGYVCTGIESTQATGGVPWRSLRLQPSDDTDTLPDWAFMDLFVAPSAGTAPTANLQAFYTPHSATGGRVNINASTEPFTGIDRKNPLVAVLKGALKKTDNNSTLSEQEAKELADRILDPGNPSNVAGETFGQSDLFDSPGEICEIKGVADDGEESEELIRQIANLITTRGDVVSVYSIGQAGRFDSATNTFVPSAEQRAQAMIERYAMASIANPGETETRFRTVYYRNLTP